MDKFWVKWNSKFSKKSLIVDYVDGCHNDEEMPTLFPNIFLHISLIHILSLHSLMIV